MDKVNPENIINTFYNKAVDRWRGHYLSNYCRIHSKKRNNSPHTHTYIEMTQNPGADVKLGHGDKSTSFSRSLSIQAAAANNKGSFLFPLSFLFFSYKQNSNT